MPRIGWQAAPLDFDVFDELYDLRVRSNAIRRATLPPPSSAGLAALADVWLVRRRAPRRQRRSRPARRTVPRPAGRRRREPRDRSGSPRDHRAHPHHPPPRLHEAGARGSHLRRARAHPRAITRRRADDAASLLRRTSSRASWRCATSRSTAAPGEAHLGALGRRAGGGGKRGRGRGGEGRGERGCPRDEGGGGMGRGRGRAPSAATGSPPAADRHPHRHQQAQVLAVARRRRNTSAAIDAPTVMPVSRAVASRPPAAPARSRGALPSIVRLLGAWKKPNPAPTAPCATMSSVAASAELRQQPQADGQHEQSRRCPGWPRDAVGQTAGERRDQAHADRPRRHQQARLHLVAVQRLLEPERQREEGQHLGRERADRGRHRQPDHRVAQQVDRHQRARASGVRAGTARCPEPASRRARSTPPARARRAVSVSTPMKNRPKVSAFSARRSQSSDLSDSVDHGSTARHEHAVDQADRHVDREQPLPRPQRQDA